MFDIWYFRNGVYIKIDFVIFFKWPCGIRCWAGVRLLEFRVIICWVCVRLLKFRVILCWVCVKLLEFKVILCWVGIRLDFNIKF
jgi:hypothetical protein